MIRICSKCGALLLDDAETCSFCNVPLAENAEIPQPVAAVARVSGESDEPEWRVEVSRRLEQYRARRGRLRPDDPQSGLPFREEHSTQAFLDDEEVRERPRQRFSLRQRHTERVDICIQPELDFSSASDDRARPQTALVPVATLAERRWAGLIDALCLGFTCAGFLGLFLLASHSAGGELTFGKVDAIIYFAVAYLFYALYFVLFTTLSGATPGMQLRGLSVVRLDGSLPETRQLVWRSFGYLLSGATLMSGFLWAMWDEDRFTWQDRISQTYVTAAAPLSDHDLLHIPARQQSFAHNK